MKHKLKIMMVGLDAAGRTTILYKLKLGEVVTTIPTIGFNVETINYRDTAITIHEYSGIKKVRPLWKHGLDNGRQCVVFVIDSNDRERIDDTSGSKDDNAKDELKNLLKEDELKDSLLLVLANKQDLPNCMSVNEIIERLGLNRLRNRKWYIFATCACTGDGLYEGLDWVINMLYHNHK